MSDKITVQFLGNCSVKWNDVPITSEKMQKDSQFTRLLFVLLHNAKTGIHKGLLEELVVGEKEKDEPHTALRVIVYKARQKLISMGFPAEDWFYQQKGIYYWNSDVEIDSDVEAFVNKYTTAEYLKESEDPLELEEALTMYLDACYLYQGEFMGMYVGESWFAQENKRYRKVFKNCVQNASEMLRNKKEWITLEKLGRYAASVDPCNDWEILTMEALVKMGKSDEASDFYNDVVEFYLNSFGIYPSRKLIEILDSASDQNTMAALDNIQVDMDEMRAEYDGGYECSFVVFRGIYQHMIRMMERDGQAMYLMLCTLVDSKGNPIHDIDMDLETLGSRLRHSIGISIRRSDVLCQYGKSQYLILLTRATKDSVELVQNRINHHFIVGGKKIEIKYHVNTVIFELGKK